MDIYGKIDITGCHADHPEPCPRKWDPVRKYWSDEWKSHLFENELIHLKDKYAAMD